MHISGPHSGVFFCYALIQLLFLVQITQSSAPALG
jgi:hypothetical protein